MRFDTIVARPSYLAPALVRCLMWTGSALDAAPGDKDNLRPRLRGLHPPRPGDHRRCAELVRATRARHLGVSRLANLARAIRAAKPLGVGDAAKLRSFRRAGPKDVLE